MTLWTHLHFDCALFATPALLSSPQVLSKKCYFTICEVLWIFFSHSDSKGKIMSVCVRQYIFFHNGCWEIWRLRGIECLNVWELVLWLYLVCFSSGSYCQTFLFIAQWNLHIWESRICWKAVYFSTRTFSFSLYTLARQIGKKRRD